MTSRHATAAVACALAVLGTGCASITGDANAPVAIEFVLPSGSLTLTVQEFDTVPLVVRVRDRAGDTIPGAPVQLISLNPDTLGIDSATSSLIGIQPGPARVVAISGSLHSNPLQVSVVRAPDSLALASPAVDTVLAADSASAQLVVQLLDLRTQVTPTGLVGYPVTFAIVAPVFSSPAAATVALGNDSLTAVVQTTTYPVSGAASVIVKRVGPPPQPDSVVVRASATRANGTVVRGSPISFVVRFQ